MTTSDIVFENESEDKFFAALADLGYDIKEIHNPSSYSVKERPTSSKQVIILHGIEPETWEKDKGYCVSTIWFINKNTKQPMGLYSVRKPQKDLSLLLEVFKDYAANP